VKALSDKSAWHACTVAVMQLQHIARVSCCMFYLWSDIQLVSINDGHHISRGIRHLQTYSIPSQGPNQTNCHEYVTV